MKVLPTYDASKVTANGPGLSALGVPASMPADFVVDARDAGQGLLSVHVTVRHYLFRTFFKFEHFLQQSSLFMLNISKGYTANPGQRGFPQESSASLKISVAYYQSLACTMCAVFF